MSSLTSVPEAARAPELDSAPVWASAQALALDSAPARASAQALVELGLEPARVRRHPSGSTMLWPVQ
jgi:hypothetical protein